MDNGVQDPNTTEKMSTDTPMDEQVASGKGKAPIVGPGEHMHDDEDDEDESEEDEEVSRFDFKAYFDLSADM
jgi:hypothetical protein